MIGYKGSAEYDTGYYFCPYIPGFYEVDGVIEYYPKPGPTDFQERLMRSLKETPVLRKIYDGSSVSNKD